MPIPSVTQPPPAFASALAELAAMAWRPGITVEEIGSPQRIAPHSIAVSADFIEDEDLLANGRLILLHDPAGNEAWAGTFRIVSYVRADVDLEMVADPLLPEVAWSWLVDALDEHSAEHHSLAGTVTASYGKSFGEMEGNDSRGEVELRSSWTPMLDADHRLTGHLRAWQDLLGHVAGRPSLPAGVVQFPGRS